jgi:signal transduction histidine kinase
MSPRRRTSARPDVGPHQAPTEHPPRQTLLAKYQQLVAKHDALVRKLELRNSEHLSTYRLSVWALETSTSAFALMRMDVVLLATARWHELAKGGPWQPLDKPSAPSLANLTQVSSAALEQLLASSEPGPLVERYQEQGQDRVLEVRIERVQRTSKLPDPKVVLVVAHDVTQQVHSERALAQAQAALVEQEHLRALGEMASGVAHDLNNTLNAMKLRLELLQRTEAAPGHSAHLDALVRIVADASTRVRRLQEFSRQRTELIHEQAQLEEVIAEAVEIARSDIEHRAIREGISVRFEVELTRFPPVSASAMDLRYVFINLLLNARDAMPRGGTILVRGGVKDGKAVVTVEDEGTGIPEKHLRSLFRPFFTTKGKHGTGLGLSMAYGVMSRVGGSITAANRPGGGACFTLSFPLPEHLPAAPPQAPAPPTPARKGGNPGGKNGVKPRRPRR